MKIWYLKNINGSRNIPYRNYGAAGKARQDAYLFLDEIGATPINEYIYKWDDEPDNVLSARLDGLLGGLKEGDVVIQMYPTGTNSTKHNEAVYNKIHSFGAKVVGYNHDIELYRAIFQDPLVGANPIPFNYFVTKKVLCYYDAFILPTEALKQRLINDFEFEKPIIVGGPVAYNIPAIPEQREKTNQVVFAGSINKTSYFNQLLDDSPNLKFNIYGKASGKDYIQKFIQSHTNANYKGSFDPDAIALILEGSYGLVWDSYSYPNISGGVGFYQQLNSPHKLSMYLAAELPVIVWSKMAFADYILENNVGWVIDDLSQLQDLINNITEDDYKSKLNSLMTIGGLIRSGMQFKQSIFSAVLAVNESSNYRNSLPNPVPQLGIEQWVVDVYQANDYQKIKDTLKQKETIDHFKQSKHFNDIEIFNRAKEILKELDII
jgi:glycosyltransferase involved in cell wall biosynthesis